MNKLSRIHSPWRRLILSLCLCALGWLNKLASPRAKIHWIGNPRRRRPERAVFTFVFLSSLVAFGSRQYLVWSILWGGMLAIFLNLLMIYWAFPRKRAHWVG